MNAGKCFNIGCGRAPTEGWINLDHSVSVSLGRLPFLVSILKKLRLLKPPQIENIEFNRHHTIRRFDALGRLPCGDNEAEVVYASHMVEHFSPDEANRFLLEAKRILRPGGTVRLALPNLQRLVARYNETGDANSFVRDSKLGQKQSKSTLRRLRDVLLDDREHHRWMYDPASARKLLEEVGFSNVRSLEPGETGIPNPGTLNLSERMVESLYVEGTKR
jgi:predicted SAM-dependent methyltransferase